MKELLRSAMHGGTAPSLPESEWRELLAYADRKQLTLHLCGLAGLPEWVCAEMDQRWRNNAERRRRLKLVFAEVSGALGKAGIEFVLLKGFSHEGSFGVDPGARVQYDLDLWIRPEDRLPAEGALLQEGYVRHGKRSLSDEHARPLVKPHSWSFRGHYFDPEMPVAVELHSTLWSPAKDHIRVEGLEDFWLRRVGMQTEEIRFQALAQPDRLGFAALHGLRHILRQDARPAHMLELARFLRGSRGDDCFWTEWKRSQHDHLRLLESVSFRFASEWFGVPLPRQIEEEVSRWPATVQRGFRRSVWSPLENLSHPNKDVLWLHLALTEGAADRWHVLQDKLLPLRWPHGEGGGKYSSRLRERGVYHLRALVSTLGRRLTSGRVRTMDSSAEQTPSWKRESV